jgi:hypothetical protein
MVLFAATFVPVPISLNVPETPQKPAQSYEVMYHGTDAPTLGRISSTRS